MLCALRTWILLDSRVYPKEKPYDLTSPVSNATVENF